ncbi:protein TPX2 [Amaranthus tricolor]|uniref:protein TPX2 n=1 Tax=Amaranthus tricolor TaxID=29722 RepID=UPI00258A6DE0|nr:protein TPX2 [Amaranthus tricolor]
MEDLSATVIDEIYEFSAPKFFDFINGESDQEKRNAELWFETALSHAPSPFMLRIRAARSVQLSSICDFGDDTQETTKAPELLEPTKELSSKPEQTSFRHQNIEVSTEQEENSNPNLINAKTANEESIDERSNEAASCDKTCRNKSTVKEAAPDVKIEQEIQEKSVASRPSQDVCTPKPLTVARKGGRTTTESKRQQTAKKIASALMNPSALKSKIQSHTGSAKPAGVRSNRKTCNLSSATGTPNLVQENQAIKRQKLEDGKTRQILSIKPPNYLHKTRPGVATSSSNVCALTTKTAKEDRKIYVRDPPVQPVPFVSTAEFLKKFQSSTRNLSLPNSSLSQGKPRLQLTRPKEPEFVTSQRVRLVKVKSSDELEQEMMAKMPKFKARPLNKKILEAPSLPPLPKSLPPKPEFQEFHLETMERANKNADSSSVISTNSAHQKSQWKPNRLTEPKTPVLQTSLRARPTKVRSSLEIEQEELEKIPKFKARPLNKKIFESKGEMGMFCNIKKQVTVPQEFHFAIDERIPPPSSVADLFDKLSLNSESNHDNIILRITRPNPFHLYTEERGTEKERRFITEVVHKQIEEEKARVPKATPYPYTTDFPVIPPKPDPKECTQPEPFQLESLIRHENEMRREMEERLKKEREEAQMRIFKAQPVLKEDPIPLPQKERKPLTDVQEFNLHLEHRAVDRAEFDKKIKEKEVMYKRYREEAEAEKQMEEEKALKQLRRTLVPHARPVPKFANPFVPQKSCKGPTNPKSPKLRVLQRKERKVSAGSEIKSAQSAAAAQMR